MAGFKNLEDLVGDLGEGLRKLRAGELEPEELNPLVEDARELCDRLTLLRFKAHEFSYEVRRKAPQGGVDNALADRQPLRPFRIGAAYQTSLIDVIEEVSREQAERAEAERRDAGTPGLFDAVVEEEQPAVYEEEGLLPEVSEAEGAGPDEIPTLESEETVEPLEASAGTFDEPEEAVGPLPSEEKEEAAFDDEPVQQAPPQEEMDEGTAEEEGVVKEPLLVPDLELSPSAALVGESGAQEDTPTLAERMERMPIDDMRKAFSLVEKYECIKMLFEDDAVEFNRVLEALEEAGTFELALHWLSQHVPAFAQWDREDPSVMRFLDRVERRYL